MHLNEIDYGTARPVEGYGPGFFRVAGKVIEGPLVLTPRGAAPWDGSAAPLLALAGDVDVVFLGTGGDIANPPEHLVTALEEAGMGVEIMSSPSACRTYNVLLGEGRRIAAALLPVEAPSEDQP